MTSKHRLLTILLALALLLGMAAASATVSAAALSTKEKADAMHELGLFQGTDVKADGTPEYSLDTTATRAQAATMLVRLLGKESEAQAQYAAGTISAPFTDLSWEAAVVTWLYANGKTQGTSSTTYSGSDNISARDFATFILRALGYSSETDFHYTQSLAFAVEKQVITESQSTAYQADFRRSGMVEMCYSALHLKMNNSTQTMLEKLDSEGVFDKKDPVVETGPITLTVKYTGGGTANPIYMEEKGLGNAVCDDIDGDGKLEIVFGVRSIFCADAATGKLKWRVADDGTYEQAENARVPLQILDWDGDGKKEIFVMTFLNTKATVRIIDSAGTIETSWVIDTGHNVWAGYPADLDGDGKYELVIGMGVGEAGERGTPAIYVYNNNGSVRSGWPQNLGYGVYSNSITAVDLDRDGKQEILITYDETQIAAFHADGTKVTAPAFGTTWDKVRFFEGGDNTSSDFSSTRELRYGIMGTYSGLIADDLDGDGKMEIIGVSMINDNQITADRMSSGQGTSFVGTAKYFGTYILNLDRTRYKNTARGFDWSHIPTDTGTTIFTLNKVNYKNPGAAEIDIEDPDYRPVTADLDGDGAKEILYTANDGLVHCFHLDGTEHGSWPFNLNGASSVVTYAGRPAAADVNGDGKLEVIFATYTPHGQNAVRGKLYVLDYTGKTLAEVTLPPQFYTNADSNYANGSQTTPVVADIDNDGKMEIVVATYNCGLVAYEIS